MPDIKLPNNWKPRDYQLPAWRAWERGIRRHILIWHRRAGKDEIALHMGAVAAHERPANYWHCLPQFSQARRAIWEAVNPHTGKKRIDEAFPHPLRSSTRQDTMTIEFKSGSVWRVVGSDDPDSLVGAPPAGIVFSEWALSNPSAWGYLAPILEENNGWASFITTPRGKNHAYTMLQMARSSPDWFAEVLTPKETGFSLDRIETQRKEYHSIFGMEAGDALIEQEYWCSFEAAILGAIWGKEMSELSRSGRLRTLEPIKGYPLHTAWDMGIRDSMVIWFFQVIPGLGGQAYVLVLGCYAASNYGIKHYADVIKEYAERLGLERGEDYVPHDARQREMGVWHDDPLSPKDGEAKQRIEVMIECGLHPKKIMDHALQDGISAVRQVLPICWIDETRCCENAVEGLRQYQTEWDDEKKIFSDKPLHNWASHYADAFRTLAMAYREVQLAPVKRPDRAVVVGGTPVPGLLLPTYDDLAAIRETPRRQRI